MTSDFQLRGKGEYNLRCLAYVERNASTVAVQTAEPQGCVIVLSLLFV